jgi:hypothetical protein
MKYMMSLRALALPLAVLLLPSAGVSRQGVYDPTPNGAHKAVPATFRRNYQATAYISFLSVSIFSRSGVGFGFASSAEHATGDSRTVTLRFLSGSTPERAAGLNRFGFMEENVERKNDAIVGANYFGLITSNGEESLADAKAALHDHRDQVPFVGAQAVIVPGNARYSIRHMLLPSHFRGSNADLLLERVRAEFAQPSEAEKEKTEAFNGQTLGTFLYSLQEAMQAEAPVYDGRFIYNGKIFKLHAVKRRDTKTGEDLRKKGITAAADNITGLNGTIVNEKTKESTPFRLWFENGSPNFLPLRFEYKPKGYLKLVFDAEPLTKMANTQEALNAQERSEQTNQGVRQ